MVQEVNGLADVKKAVAGEGLVVVDVFASWCPPCKALAPQLDQIAAANKDVTFIKVDGDKHRDVPQFVGGFQGFPTIVFYKGGAEVDRVVGANVAAINNAIKKYS